MNKHSLAVLISVMTVLSGCATAPQGVDQAGNAGSAALGSAVANNMPVTGSSALGALAGQTASAGAGQTSGLVNVLVQQLGVSPQQATGGAGSIFALAKQSLGASSFGQVSQAVPGMSQLLSAAPAASNTTSGTGSLLGSAASALGTNSSLGNLASLAGSFQSLGLGSGMVGKFIPVILQYVQTQGGASTMGLLKGALMP